MKAMKPPGRRDDPRGMDLEPELRRAGRLLLSLLEMARATALRGEAGSRALRLLRAFDPEIRAARRLVVRLQGRYGEPIMGHQEALDDDPAKAAAEGGSRKG